MPVLELKFLPLTAERWPDLESLFSINGATDCWCMWWRLKGSEYERQRGQANKQALKKIVDSGEVPGILAYAGKQAIGWCSLGLRERLGRLERSPRLRRVDSQPVWSIVCFFVDKRFRGQGVAEGLLKAAVEYAKGKGAKIVEGYPVEMGESIKLDSASMGVAPMFRKLGFVEVLRRSEMRPIMRYFVDK